MPAPSATPDPAASVERRVGARMVALSLAMQAKSGSADERTLRLAVVATAEALTPHDPVAAEVRVVARSWMHLRHHPEALRQAGDDLFRAVERSCWPSPSARADLEG